MNSVIIVDSHFFQADFLVLVLFIGTPLASYILVHQKVF
jgi:hypothetical protein